MYNKYNLLISTFPFQQSIILISINKLIDWYNVLVNKDLEFFADYCVADAFHVYLFKKNKKQSSGLCKKYL